jgi:putative Mg2+ transporter-C (MgtC) family protein
VNNFDALIHLRLANQSWAVEAVVELLLAAAAGGLVGLERELRGRQAGFRTNLLVCVGSALVMIVSSHVARMAWPHQAGVNINIDPARIAYGVMGGIGFLGAGTIIQHRGSVRGLTTAAGMWCVAALGLASGLGMYSVTLTATVIVLGALWILDFFENMLPTTHFRTIRVRCRWRPGAIVQVVEWVKAFGFKVQDVHFERTEDLQDVDVAIGVAFRNKRMLYELEQRAQAETDFQLMALRQS